MKLIISVLISVLIPLSSAGQNVQSVKAIPFPGTSVTLLPSFIKQREELNTAYLKSLDPERLLHNFRVNAGIASTAKPLEGWEAPGIGLRGHFTGHYLSAAAYIVEIYKDPLLSERLSYMVDELYKCQQKLGNGYLSAFPERDFNVLETRFGGVWAPYYTLQKIMQGLLDVYVRTGNKKAYEMVLEMASYVNKRMSKLDEATIEKMLNTTAANPSNEAGAMNEVLYNLYKVSGNTEHLNLAKKFERDWFLKPLAQNINILSGLHSNTHLVLVNGFSRGYETTGDPVRKAASLNFWKMLISDHAYANGSSSGPRPNVTTPTSLTAEHWGVPRQLSNTMTKETGESCVTHNTQKLTSALFSWSADPKYAEVYMNTFLNSTLALQSSVTGRVTYHLPLGSPRKKVWLTESDYRCCNGSSIEAFTQLNSGIYFHNETDLWVNLYIPSQVSWKEKGIDIKQTGNFPADSTILISLSLKEKSEFAVNLIIPSWAKKADLFVNNQKQKSKITPGSFIRLKREWKDNDEIKLVFSYDYYVKPMPDDKNVIALFHGPVMLAFEESSELVMKGTVESILQNISVADNGCYRLKNNGREYTLIPLYNIEDQSYGVYATIRNY